MRTPAVLWTAFLVCAAGAAHGAENRPVFSARSEMVQISVTILGPERPLSVEDVTVNDNGRPQLATYLSSEPLPLDVFVLMDTSNSMVVQAEYQKPRLRPEMVSAVQTFIKMLRPIDRMQIREFSERSNTLVDLTADQGQLKKALAHATIGGGETRLLRELYVQINELIKMPVDPEQPHHRVVIVITDSTDTTAQTEADQKRLIEKVRAAKVAIYVLGIQPSAYTMSTFDGEKSYLNGRYLMQQACKESGGTFTEARNPELMLRLANNLSSELATEYVVWWPVPNDGEISPWHTVQLQVRGIPSDRLRHAPGYLRSLK